MASRLKFLKEYFDATGYLLNLWESNVHPDPEAADFLCFSRSSSEYAYTASTLSAGLGDEMTIEAWVQSTDATNPFQTIARYFGTKGMHITLISGKVNAGFNNGSGGNLSGATVITDGNWHHVVVTAESGHIIIYVDGQMDGEVYDDPGDFNSINTNFYVGGYPNIINYYSNACIKEVSFWNYAKDATDVLGNFENYDGYTGLETGLITYWKLTEGTGTSCDNLVSGTHDLTAVNTPTWGTDDYLVYYVADVESYCDYTPYGVEMENRHTGGSDYRYGFQGQEDDGEIKGEGHSWNYKYRMHDPRLGRFFAVDPLAASYPHNSPYAFSENVVINAVELEGLEQRITVTIVGPDKPLVSVKPSAEIEHDFDFEVVGELVTYPNLVNQETCNCPINIALSELSEDIAAHPDGLLTLTAKRYYEVLNGDGTVSQYFEWEYNYVYTEGDDVVSYVTGWFTHQYNSDPYSKPEEATLDGSGPVVIYLDPDEAAEDKIVKSNRKNSTFKSSAQKGKYFRGGSKKDRDYWGKYSKDKDFQRWWHRAGKKEYGGNDIEPDQLDEIYDDWVSRGRPIIRK